MDKQLLEDALYAFFISTVEPEIQEVDRFADDIRAEVNRYKRELRKGEKKIKQTLEYCAARNEDGTLFRPDWENNPDAHWIHSCHVLVGFLDQLESNTPLPKEVEKILGFAFDYTKLSKRKRQWIRWHAIAQIIALEDPRKRISEIKREILGDHRLERLLGFCTLPSLGNPQKKREDRFREIENAIGEVVKWGVGRPAKDAKSTVVISPPVYSDGKVNFQALSTVMSAVGSALKIWGRPLPENYALPVIDLYKKALPASLAIDAVIRFDIVSYYDCRGKGEYYD